MCMGERKPETFSGCLSDCHKLSSNTCRESGARISVEGLQPGISGCVCFILKELLTGFQAPLPTPQPWKKLDLLLFLSRHSCLQTELKCNSGVQKRAELLKSESKVKELTYSQLQRQKIKASWKYFWNWIWRSISLSHLPKPFSCVHLDRGRGLREGAWRRPQD